MPQVLPFAIDSPVAPSSTDATTTAPPVIALPSTHVPASLTNASTPPPPPLATLSESVVAAADAPPPTPLSALQNPTVQWPPPQLLAPHTNIPTPLASNERPPNAALQAVVGHDEVAFVGYNNHNHDIEDDESSIDNSCNDNDNDGAPLPTKVNEAIRRNLLGPDAGDFTDVVLLCSDGVEIPVCRSLLAIRSEYFKNLFYLPFREKRSTSIPVNIHSSPLNEVLHFAYTDSSPLIESMEAIIAAKRDSRVVSPTRSPSFSPGTSPRQEFGGRVTSNTGIRQAADGNIRNPGVRASTSYPLPDDPLFTSVLGKRRQPEPADLVTSIVNIVDLASVADYVELPLLAKKAISIVTELTTFLPFAVCPAFQAVTERPIRLFRPLKEQLRSTIRFNPYECFGIPDMRACISHSISGSSPTPNFPRTVANLSEQTLQTILSDSDIVTSETYLFETLFFWLTGSLVNTIRTANESRIEEWKQSSKWPAAKRLVQFIDLERLKPSFIRDYILPLGIVDTKRLFDTFLQQALQAERGRPFFDNFRGGSRWFNDRKRIRATSPIAKLFILNGPRMNSGRHEWSFRIVKNSPVFWIGIMKFGCRFDGAPSIIFDGDRGWGYSTSGKISPLLGTDYSKSKKPPGPRLTDGDVVKIILNLTKSGTLTVNGPASPKSFPAFREMRTRVSSFSLVVSFSLPGEIELISEKHHLTSSLHTSDL